LPSWIRIQIRNPDPLTSLNPDPIRIRVRNPGSAGFGDGKTKKVRDKKVPAGDSYSAQKEEKEKEVVDQFSDEEMVSRSDEEMGVEVGDDE
jgi:hypothetical protein